MPEYWFVDLANFTKDEQEIDGLRDFWLYLLRNSRRLKTIPSKIRGEGIEDFEQAARVSAFSPGEFDQYVHDIMTQRDYNSALNLARAEGKEEGRAEGKEEGLAEGLVKGKEEGRSEGKEEIAKAMKSKSISPDVIAECTGLSQDRISAL